MQQEQPLQPKKVKTQQQIKDIRFKKQMEMINQKYHVNVEENPDSSKDIKFLLNIHEFQQISFVLHIPKDYPFQQPKFTFVPPEVKIAINQGFISRQDNQKQKLLSELMGFWAPGMRLSQITDEAISRISKSLVNQNSIRKNFLYEIMQSSNSIYIILLFAVLVRLLVGLGGYSGQNSAPQFGDFQAHRNWISLTHNRYIQNWYQQFDQKPWWRLDYPPVAGYLSYFFSFFLKYIHPQGLVQQHGYQHPTLRVFMRMTVIFSDLIFFFIPSIWFYRTLKLNKRIAKIVLLIFLLVPGFLLIDHGHFQYNCVMLGLVFLAYLCIITNHEYLGCIFFTIALSKKQMALYYALGFFSLLVGRALIKSRIIIESSYIFNLKFSNFVEFLIIIFSYGWIVILVTIILWLPWISVSVPELILEPLSAIFPVHRGLYQLKVGNFWCITDTIFKWQHLISQKKLLGLCFIFTLIGSIPSMIVSALVPRTRFALYALFNISLSFYFFSYHVHQKTILVPLLFISLNFKKFSFMALDFIMLASVNMYHLLKEDKQVIQYFAVNIVFFYFCNSTIKLLQDLKYTEDQATKDEFIQNQTFKKLDKLNKFLRKIYMNFLRYLVYIIIICLHIAEFTVKPPEKLPYLFNLLFAGIAFFVFMYIFIYSNLQMIYEAYKKVTRIQKKIQKFD